MSILANIAKRLLLLATMSLIIFSCSKDNTDAPEQEQNQKVTQAELKTILDTDNLSGVADTIVADLFNQGKSGKSKKNNDCYNATYSDTGFTVTFPDCDIEGSTEKLNGTLTVVYGKEGDSYAFAVTFDNLMVGAISINGTRSFSISGGDQQNSAVLNVTSDMSITMADDSVISEKGTKSLALVFGEELGDGMFTLDGEWTVIADGNTYTIDVTQLLESNFDCDYIGKGLMLLSKNGLAVSIDFGDGSCDDIASVIYPNGAKEDITLEK